MKKKVLIALVSILAVAGVFCTIFWPDSEINNTIDTVQDIVINEIKEEDNASTVEIPENVTEETEKEVEHQELEAEDFEEQGEVAYNGSEQTPYVEVGSYSGLTYYSQTDSRWGYKMYSNHNDPSQTIANSGCGPTSAAMVVSSIKGTITPDSMANLYMNYGYRSYNNGTYLSAFKWTADTFNISYQESVNLDFAVQKVKDNNYVIVSCNQGLFTYGGHFIVIVGIEGDNLKIYDPYLYSGKFDTATRRGKAEIKGNTVYVSIDNFRNYANAIKYFCFKRERADGQINPTNVDNISNTANAVANTTSYNVRVTANSGLNVRSGPGTNYKRVNGYSKNTIVTILQEQNGWGKTNQGWIYLMYTSRITAAISSTSSTGYVLGLYRVNTRSGLNVRSGPSTGYKVKRLYINGTRFDTYEIRGNWARTPSGWVCLSYCQLVYKY